MFYQLFLFVFFFNDTATTEIYTYWTHSFPTRRSSDLAAQALLAEKPRRQIVGDPDHGFEDVPFSPNTADLDKVVAYANRSEEHTSELQSLMRISYAVFCLKKKKT